VTSQKRRELPCFLSEPSRSGRARGGDGGKFPGFDETRLTLKRDAGRPLNFADTAKLQTIHAIEGNERFNL